MFWGHLGEWRMVLLWVVALCWFSLTLNWNGPAHSPHPLPQCPSVPVLLSLLETVISSAECFHSTFQIFHLGLQKRVVPFMGLLVQLLDGVLALIGCALVSVYQWLDLCVRDGHGWYFVPNHSNHFGRRFALSICFCQHKKDLSCPGVRQCIHLTYFMAHPPRPDFTRHQKGHVLKGWRCEVR